ncbi:hypothetical protein HDU98_006666, partial [Podochytrium sp. JEL0797]
MALEISTGVNCGVGLPNEVLLCTNESPSILSLSWDGILNEFDTIALSELAFLKDRNFAISNITVTESELFAWIDSAGNAFVAQRTEEVDELENNHVENDQELIYTWAGMCFHDTASSGISPATCVAVNARFLWIAVGDSKGRVEIHSLSADHQEVLHSHDLVVGPGQSDLYALKFLQSPLITCQNLDNVSNIFLVGDDRLLIRDCSNDGLDAISLDMTLWDSVQVPYATIDSTGTFIAIAGTRGLAHYNIPTGRWKLFGNEVQEQSFSVDGGLFWFETMIVAATEDLVNPGFQIRIFSREANLDLKCLYIESVAVPVVTMTNVGPTVVSLMEDNVLRRFMIVQSESGVTLELRQQILLDSVVHHIDAIQSLAWNPFENSHGVVQDSILLLHSGSLSMLSEKTTGTWEHTPIAEKIEFFWVSRGECGLKQTLWAFGHDGLQIWVVQEQEGAVGYRYTRENQIQVEMPFYPLSIMFSRGLIFGLESGISTNMAAQCILYRPAAESQLFLDAILRFFLKAKSPDAAFDFICHYQHLNYFSHSLEMLLHNVLEQEADSKIGSRTGALLPDVIEFLERFPSFLDIVAQCARKSDVSIWKYFFEVVGEPQTLFEECLKLGYLRTATSYLIIIQTLESTSVSVKFAEALLQRALDLSDFKTAKELIRFYKSIDGYSDEMVHALRVSTERLNLDPAPIGNALKSPEKLTSPVDPSSNTFHLEIVVNTHARKLLIEYRIRALGQFSKLFSIPLDAWWKKEREHAPHVSDWSLAFATLHDQFDLSYPEYYGQETQGMHARRGKRQSLPPMNLRSTLLPAPASSAAAKSPLRLDMTAVTRVAAGGPKSARVEPSRSMLGSVVFEEIKFLATSAANANATPWALLLFSLVFDVQAIAGLLAADSDEREEEGERWKEVMRAASLG